MKFTLRAESSRHAVIVDEDNAEHPWIATINTENAPGRADAVLKAIQDAASANTTKLDMTNNSAL